MSPSTLRPDSRGPNCWQCRFFAISWDPRLPYACQRMGFKTNVLPAIEVLRTDGTPCRGFERRPPKAAPDIAATASPADPPARAARITSTQSWQA